jgi:UDP-N-acetylglucosamine:LPS N-acetylglucosamine transferase
MKIALIKQLNGSFIPAYDSDHEIAKKIKVNSFYEFDFKKPRNYMFHKKFFALINLAYHNQDTYNNIDDMREDLIIDAGFYRTTDNKHAETVKKALSISFASMDEIKFNELYSRVADVIVKWLGIEKQDIVDNIQMYF